jgi:hypothetical protein
MASVLNDGPEWHHIPAQDRSAFRGTPVKTLVQPQRMLCRFITTESPKRGIRGNETFKSSLWMDWSTTVSMLARWSAAGRIAPREVIRARMAVPQLFSPELDSLVQTIFTKPVYGWKGTAQFQTDSARGMTYLGGGEQYYIPHLASDSLGLNSKVAYFQCFTSVDSLV